MSWGVSYVIAAYRCVLGAQVSEDRRYIVIEARRVLVPDSSQLGDDGGQILSSS